MIKGIFTDFLILLFIVALLLSLVLLFTKIIFRDEGFDGSITLTSCVLPDEYLSLVREGDEVFDCITKRRVGKVRSVSFEEVPEGTRLLLVLVGERKIKQGADAVRTKELFIELSRAPVYD